MNLAQKIAAFSAGGFLLAGLLFGVWKYLQISQSPKAQASPYVDIAHRAALLYSFACLVVERFVVLSALDDTIELIAVIAQIGFFAVGVSTYVIHGLLKDTDNQFERPHRLGRAVVPPAVMVASMVALIAGELGGFAVLFWGAVTT
ncbi:hypothetical protein HUA74_23765 [Myxococcus sp. CA051A]|uniref:hypothetical protein n=1 Tax=unclassified Myxococcus TaxID=2648731 RepID=UPI00157AC8DB|nr:MULTISPECIES: hypothetical protein [unclassified Myxococcus]NTX51456.1 hypothetical protein [Myxococcus sp. CA039A]NTX63678.1 hypothetical protein [Myxococcus sp. CA051A]